jgi:hypothetical protein
MATLTAVPGAMWPGSVWPGYIPSVAPVSVSPVLFSLGRARNGASGLGGTLTQPATSSPFVQVQVIATLDGAPYDPTADPVAIAFVPVPQYGAPPNPVSGQWNTASWETDSSSSLTTYWASVLTGPSGVSLTAGAWAIAVQVTDGGVARVMWALQSLLIT